MIGGHVIWEGLVKEGVEVVFGYPGAASIPLYDTLPEYPQVHHVLVRHEQGAVHAADGYARATGRVGVCTATSGPGATNLVTGIATAFADSVPMVAITAQVARSAIGKDAFQEVDITGITLPVTKESYLVLDVGQLAEILKEAFFVAWTGRPGPVLIDIPRDVLSESVDYVYPETLDLPGYEGESEDYPIPEVPECVDLVSQTVNREIHQITNGMARVVTGVGRLKLWSEPGCQIASGGMGTLGFSLPAAVGAQVGCPDETVWCIDGDGSFQMTVQELGTIMQERLKLKMAVINSGRYINTELSGPDFIKIAEAYEIPALRVINRDGVQPAIERAMDEDGPFLIDFAINPGSD